MMNNALFAADAEPSPRSGRQQAGEKGTTVEKKLNVRKRSADEIALAYMPLGRKVAWSYAGRGAEYEDLVQEAFYRALHHTQELDGMDLAQGRAWLYRTVKNLFVDRFRRERRESVMAELPEEARYTDYGELENAQLLSGLPEEERILFTMRYLEGYNSRELGELFGIPPATVRMRLASARRHLQREWED